MKNSINKIEKIRKELMRKFPLMGNIISQVEFQEAPNIVTACTDGQKIFYDSNLFENFTYKDAKMIIAHESLHIAFDHVLRSEGKDLDLWNIATDSVVNQILDSEGLGIPDGMVDIKEALNRSADEMYDKLLEKRKQKQSENQQNSGGNPQSQSGNQQSSSQQGGQSGSGQGSPQPQSGQGGSPQQSNSGQGIPSQSTSGQGSSSQSADGQNNPPPNNMNNASDVLDKDDIKGGGGKSQNGRPQQNTNTQSNPTGNPQSSGQQGTPQSNPNREGNQNPQGSKESENNNPQATQKSQSSGSSQGNPSQSQMGEVDSNQSQGDNNNQSQSQGGETGNNQTTVNKGSSSTPNGEMSSNQLPNNVDNQSQSVSQGAEGKGEQLSDEAFEDIMSKCSSMSFAHNMWEEAVKRHQQERAEKDAQNEMQSQGDNANQGNTQTKTPHELSQDSKTSEKKDNPQLSQNNQTQKDSSQTKNPDEQTQREKGVFDQLKNFLSRKRQDTSNQNNDQSSSSNSNNQTPTDSGSGVDMEGKESKVNPQAKPQEKKPTEEKTATQKKEGVESSQKTQLTDKKPNKKPSDFADFEKSFADRNAQKKREIADKIRNELSGRSHQVTAGSEPGGTQLILGDIGESDSVINWRKILKKALEKEEEKWGYRRADDDNDWQARIEDYEEEKQSLIEVLLDTSGSVDEDLLREFLRQVKNLKRDAKLYVGCFDTQFYGFTEIKKSQDIDSFRIKGRGGTSFDTALASFTKDKNTNKLIFTDGYDNVSRTEYNKNLKNVYWLVWEKSDFSPCCGKVIYVDKSRLQTQARERF